MNFYPNPFNSTICPASVHGLSDCAFCGRLVLADTSVDYGHRCTDLRSIAGNRRYRLLVPSESIGASTRAQHALVSNVRVARTPVTHVPHARSTGPILSVIFDPPKIRRNICWTSVLAFLLNLPFSSSWINPVDEKHHSSSARA